MTRVIYDEHLTPERARILEANCWKTTLFLDDPAYKGRQLDENGLYSGLYIATRAEKDFHQPKDAMFEIEELFGVDVIEDTDHDGAPIHFFRWKNPNWNGWQWKPDEDYTDNPCDSEYLGASGWECAVIMYGAPKTARATAIELQRLRSVFSK